MTRMLNKHKVALAVGSFVALWHLVWAILVGTGAAESVLDWATSLHFLSYSVSVNDFALGQAVLLVAVTFVGGYVGGWVFAAIWNAIRK